VQDAVELEMMFVQRNLSASEAQTQTFLVDDETTIASTLALILNSSGFSETASLIRWRYCDLPNPNALIF
jgi:hypothetical protein